MPAQSCLRLPLFPQHCSSWLLFQSLRSCPCLRLCLLRLLHSLTFSVIILKSTYHFLIFLPILWRKKSLVFLCEPLWFLVGNRLNTVPMDQLSEEKKYEQVPGAVPGRSISGCSAGRFMIKWMAEIGGRSVSCSHVRRMLVTSAACVNHWEALGGGHAIKKTPIPANGNEILISSSFFFFFFNEGTSFILLFRLAPWSFQSCRAILVCGDCVFICFKSRYYTVFCFSFLKCS